jgi:hypothetical protein
MIITQTPHENMKYGKIARWCTTAQLVGNTVMKSADLQTNWAPPYSAYITAQISYLVKLRIGVLPPSW